MLRSLRVARFAQVALWIAGFLAVAGAFGLHPEPAFSDPSAPESSLPGFSPASLSAGGPDGCPACLAHRPIPAASPESALAAPALLSADGSFFASVRVRALPPLPHEGRAPPARA